MTIHRGIKKHTLREYSHSTQQSICIVDQMLRFDYLPSCVILQMTYHPNVLNKDGWWYLPGDQGWHKRGHWRFHLIIWHRRQPFELAAGAPTSRSRALEQVITSNQRSTAKETEECQYCHYIPSGSKFPKTTWAKDTTTTAQEPKVSPPQRRIFVWLCTIHTRHCCLQCLMHTSMFHNPTPVEVTAFPNTTRWSSRW